VNDFNGLKLAPTKMTDFETFSTSIATEADESLLTGYIEDNNLVISTDQTATSVTLTSITGSVVATVQMASYIDAEDRDKGKEITIPMKSATLANTDPDGEKGKEITIPVKKAVSPGIYIITVKHNNGTVKTVKIIAR
jgi:hypothetical protein